MPQLLPEIGLAALELRLRGSGDGTADTVGPEIAGRKLMDMKAKKIVSEILAHIGTDVRTTWYAGIATDPEDCLFVRHKVNKANRRNWVWHRAKSNKAARKAERRLLSAGLDGGPGGGDENTKSVYAYKKSSTTSQA